MIRRTLRSKSLRRMNKLSVSTFDSLLLFSSARLVVRLMLSLKLASHSMSVWAAFFMEHCTSTGNSPVSNELCGCSRNSIECERLDDLTRRVWSSCCSNEFILLRWFDAFSIVCLPFVLDDWGFHSFASRKNIKRRKKLIKIQFKKFFFIYDLKNLHKKKRIKRGKN